MGKGRGVGGTNEVTDLTMYTATWGRTWRKGGVWEGRMRDVERERDRGLSECGAPSDAATALGARVVVVVPLVLALVLRSLLVLVLLNGGFAASA